MASFSFPYMLFYITVATEFVTSDYEFLDSLTPYKFRHGSYLSRRGIRDCHKIEYGSLPHELYPASNNSAETSMSYINVKRFVKEIPPVSILFPKRILRGHFVVLSNPLKTLSVLEPDQAGGCSLNILQTVAVTAKKGNCKLAVNAGYFDPEKGTCYGNVISDGRKAQNSRGIQNAHFGITKDGQIFTGYVSEEEFKSDKFHQLVGGYLWILRNGSGFIDVSKRLECGAVAQSGNVEMFVNILHARTIVGHDKDGNVVIVQIEGKSIVDGLTLKEVEDFLKEFELVNAINLDGGRSSTLVIDGVIANYPFALCPDGVFACERPVSTILCVHDPYCEPRDCSNHGTCSMGECVCQKNYLPPTCAELFCGNSNCSNHGVCLPEGCVCHPGYYGDNCDKKNVTQL